MRSLYWDEKVVAGKFFPNPYSAYDIVIFSEVLVITRRCSRNLTILQKGCAFVQDVYWNRKIMLIKNCDKEMKQYMMHWASRESRSSADELKTRRWPWRNRNSLLTLHPCILDITGTYNIKPDCTEEPEVIRKSVFAITTWLRSSNIRKFSRFLNLIMYTLEWDDGIAGKYGRESQWNRYFTLNKACLEEHH